jgi:phosphate-selective porin OprO/OprP
MKSCLKLGRKVIFKALTVTVLLCAMMVFTGGSLYAEDQSVAEKILNIMLKSHQISQEQYNELMKQARAEKAAQAEKLAEAQRAVDTQKALEAQTAADAQKAVEAQKVVEKRVAAVPERQPNDFRAYWRPTDGLHFTSDNKAFDIHVGGRIQIDFADAEPNDPLADWADAKSGSFTPGNKYKGTSTPTKVGGYGDQIRRARLDIDGTIYNNVEFIFQPDFAPAYSATTGVERTPAGTALVPITRTTTLTTGSAVTFADMWVGVTDIPYLGRVRVGQMYEPISIEQMTSDNWNTFMEKALPVNALIPGRNAGISVINNTCDGRLGWQVGYFFQQQVALNANNVPLDTTADLFSPHLDATQIAGRITALPLYENNGERLIHLGIGYTHEFRSNNEALSTTNPQGNPGALDFRSSPEAGLYSPLVDTGYFLANGVDILDPELAMVCGPFSLQAEYIWTAANGISGAPTYFGTKPDNVIATLGTNAHFWGWYAQVSYFLTGEHRPYNLNASPATYQGTFGRPIPNSNFDPLHGGIGAWELAFRIEELDCNDLRDGFEGGLETDYTAGLNWYLNPAVMVKVNWVHASIGAHSNLGAGNSYGNLLTTGTDNIFETRVQVAF